MIQRDLILNNNVSPNNSMKDIMKDKINISNIESKELEYKKLISVNNNNNELPDYLNTVEIKKYYHVSKHEIYQALKDVTPRIDGRYKYWCSKDVHKPLKEYIDLKYKIVSGTYINYKGIMQKYKVCNKTAYDIVSGMEYLIFNGCKYWDSKVVEDKNKELNDAVADYKKYKESEEWVNLRSIQVNIRNKIKKLIKNKESSEEQIKILYNGNKFVPLINKELVAYIQSKEQKKKDIFVEISGDLYTPQKLRKLFADILSEKVGRIGERRYSVTTVSKILGRNVDYIVMQVNNLTSTQTVGINDKCFIEEGDIVNLLKLQGYISIQEISEVTCIHQTVLQRNVNRLKNNFDKNTIYFIKHTFVFKDLLFEAVQNCLKVMALQSNSLKEIFAIRMRFFESSFTQTINLAVKFLNDEVDRLNKSTTILKKEEFGRSLNSIESILKLIDKELPQYNNEEIISLLLNPNLKQSHLIKCMKFINYINSTLDNKCNYTKQVGMSLIEQLKPSNKENKSKTYTEKEWAGYYVFLSNIDKHILKSFVAKRYAELWLYCLLQLSITWRCKDIIDKVPNIPLEIIDIYDFDWFKYENSFTLSMAIKILDSVKFGLDGVVAYKNKMNLHFNIPLSLKIPTAVALIICEIHRRKSNEDVLFNSLKLKRPRYNTDFKFFFSGYEDLEHFSNLKATRTLMSLNYATAVKTVGMAGVAYVLNQYSRSHKVIDDKISNTTATYLQFSNIDGSPEDVAYETIEQGYCGFLYTKLILSCFPKENADLVSREDLTELVKDTRKILSPLTIEKMSEQIINNKISLDLGIDIITGMASIEKASSEEREDLIKAIEKKIICRYKDIAKKIFTGKNEHFENFINKKCNEIVTIFKENIGNHDISKKILKEILNTQTTGFSDYCNCIFDEVERQNKCPYKNPDTCIGCRYNILNLMQLYEVNKRLNRILDKMLADEYLMETDYVKNTHLIDNYLFIIIQAKMQYENLDRDVLSAFLNEAEIKKKIQRLQELNRILYIDKYEDS